MIPRHELSDAEWEFVRPLLPESLRGRKRLDNRKILNGIVWKFRTGTAWRDVPERYGPWATLHTRFRRWAMDGTFERMLRAAQAKADAAGDINRLKQWRGIATRYDKTIESYDPAVTLASLLMWA